MLEYLLAGTHAPLRCGKEIARNQPDVEVFAMALANVPSSKAEFEAARGTREFVIAKFVVLALGPPGFGKVPYNSKRSVGVKEEQGKPLYEGTDDGRVRFFSFEKGKTNKDKGDRVEADESSGFLEPGLVLSFFLREEFWDPPKIMPAASGEDAVAAGSVVAMQVSSSNVDAAGKGYLLKLKKLKVLSSALDLFAVLAKLPQSEDEYDNHASRYRADYPAMKGSLDSSTDTRVFAAHSLGPDACAFGHEGGFLISNARTHNREGFCDDIFVPTSVARRCLQVDDETLAVKFMNMALAVQALGGIIKTCASNVLLSADDVHPLVALALVLDVNILLSLDVLDTCEHKAFLRSATPGVFEACDVVVSKTDDHIHWHNTKHKYVTDADTAQIAFTLHAADHCGPADAPRAGCGQLSKGFAGTYKTLSISLVRRDVASKIVDLEMRVADQSCMNRKRKRPELDVM